MTTKSAGEITNLLGEIAAGNDPAKARLVEIVYEELHDLAEARMKREPPGHPFQTTDLIDEAIGRLLENEFFDRARNRAFFFAAFAEAMRRILVEHARRQNRKKRGGSWKEKPFDDVLDECTAQNIDIVELNDALQLLREYDQEQYDVVKLRFYCGFTVPEVAELISVSVSKVESDWRKARAFLYGHLAAGD
jgi:RNA polymerase sigma factor (TIGR02999 family)